MQSSSAILLSADAEYIPLLHPDREHGPNRRILMDLVEDPKLVLRTEPQLPRYAIGLQDIEQGLALAGLDFGILPFNRRVISRRRKERCFRLIAWRSKTTSGAKTSA